MRVLGEGGVAQMLVAVLSLVLIAAWKEGVSDFLRRLLILSCQLLCNKSLRRDCALFVAYQAV